MPLTEIATDQALMERLQATGDREAFDQLLERWDRRVLGFLAKACGDLEAAEDLRQEVFLRVYRHAKQYDPRFAFSTWLFRIASNAAGTWRSKESRPTRFLGRREEFEGGTIEPTDRKPDAREQLGLKESRDLVRQAITGLAPRQRELLLMRFDLDMTYREIGEVHGEPETTIKSRIYVLLANLRKDFTRQGIGERT